jgi:outer membrane protein assembly factor BamB
MLIVGFGASAFGQSYQPELPSDSMLGRLGLQRAWWGFATIDSIRDRVKFFVNDEQVTVVESYTGSVTVFDNATGRRRWAVQVGAATDVRYAPGTTDQVVLIVSGRKLYGLDKQTGNSAWEVSVPVAPSTSATSDDSHAYVGSIDGSVFAYDLKFLSQLTKNVSLSKYMYRSLDWTYRTGGRIPYAAASTGTIVCVPSLDGSLYGLEIAKHHPRFQFETDQPLGAPIAQLGNQIVISTEDLKVYSLNADSGALKWETLLGLHVRQQPKIIGEHVFVCPEGGGMRCLSSQDGHEVWSNRQAVRFLAATPTLVYASTYVDDVLLLNRTNGRQVGGFALHGFPVRIANERTDRMYFASEKGLVVSIRERDREYPLYHKQPEKRPVEPEIAPDDAAAKPKKPPKKGAEAEESMEEKTDADAAPAAAPAKPAAKKPTKSTPAKKAAKAKIQKPATDSE